MLGWVWVGEFFVEVKTGCLGLVIVGFSGVFLGFFVLCFGVFCLNKVKLEFITGVISDTAICKVLYA